MTLECARHIVANWEWRLLAIEHYNALYELLDKSTMTDIHQLTGF